MSKKVRSGLGGRYAALDSLHTRRFREQETAGGARGQEKFYRIGKVFWGDERKFGFWMGSGG
jgi:hypothetical protein